MSLPRKATIISNENNTNEDFNNIKALPSPGIVLNLIKGDVNALEQLCYILIDQLIKKNINENVETMIRILSSPLYASAQTSIRERCNEVVLEFDYHFSEHQIKSWLHRLTILKIKSLSLRATYFDRLNEKLKKILIEGIKKLGKLDRLNLNGNQLVNRYTGKFYDYSIINILKACKVEELDLRWNHLNNLSFKENEKLFESIKISGVKKLILNNVDLPTSSEEFENFFQLLKKTHVITLEMEIDHATNLNWQSFFKNIVHSNITSWNLQAGGCTDFDCNAFFSAIEKWPLFSLTFCELFVRHQFDWFKTKANFIAALDKSNIIELNLEDDEFSSFTSEERKQIESILDKNKNKIFTSKFLYQHVLTYGSKEIKNLISSIQQDEDLSSKLLELPINEIYFWYQEITKKLNKYNEAQVKQAFINFHLLAKELIDLIFQNNPIDDKKQSNVKQNDFLIQLFNVIEKSYKQIYHSLTIENLTQIRKYLLEECKKCFTECEKIYQRNIFPAQLIKSFKTFFDTNNINPTSHDNDLDIDSFVPVERSDDNSDITNTNENRIESSSTSLNGPKPSQKIKDSLMLFPSKTISDMDEFKELILNIKLSKKWQSSLDTSIEFYKNKATSELQSDNEKVCAIYKLGKTIVNLENKIEQGSTLRKVLPELKNEIKNVIDISEKQKLFFSDTSSALRNFLEKYLGPKLNVNETNFIIDENNNNYMRNL